MKLIKNSKVYMTMIFICVFTMSYCISTVMAAGPSFTLSTPSTSAGEYFKGIEYDVAIITTDSVTSAKFYAPEDGGSDCTLTYIGYDVYCGDWEPDDDDDYWATLSSGRYIGRKYFKVAATNAGGTTTVVKTYSIPAESLLWYETIDNGFRFSNPSSNDFLYPESPEYNCAAYVVGIYNDDFSSIGSNSSAIAFMEKTTGTIYANRSGTLYEEASSTDSFLDAIFYSGNHFAKAASWDANGKIKSVRSKWGDYEAIYSYASTGNDHGDNFDSSYGIPSVYFNRL